MDCTPANRDEMQAVGRCDQPLITFVYVRDPLTPDDDPELIGVLPGHLRWLKSEGRVVGGG